MRYDEVFEITVALEEKLIERKGILINTDGLENISNITEEINCKFPNKC